MLLFISHFSTYSQTEDFKFLTVEDGLAQSQVHCILQDKRGYLWLGTDAGGGSIYDGKTFTNFSTADGLASNRILSFAEDNKGNIWIGTSKGVSIYNGKEFIDKPSKLEALDVRSIGTILCEKDGTIWLGTSKCLYSWNGNTLTKFDSVDGYIYTILRDSRGNLWAATDLNGLFKINGKEIKQYTRADGLSTEAITTIDEPIPGELWIGSNKGISLLHIDDDKIEHFSELKNISHLFHDTKNVWVLGEGIGICTFSGPGFKQFSNQKKIPTDAWCGIKDREENLWFGTNGAGVLKYQSTPFSRLSMENGLSGRLVFSILHDSKGNEWYGSEGGITQFGTDKATGTKKIIKFNSENPGYPDARCWAMLEDKKGNIWFSSISRGLYKYQGGAFTNYLNSNENEKYIRSLLEDDEGNIWVGSRAGLIKINDGKKIKVYGPADGLPDQAILSSLKDSKGGLWFVSNAGLFKFDPKGIKSKFISYTKADGLINDGLLAIAE
ncbi:MAG TPA: two-component regulator propeller domain-containing protein, partial [Bacteroidia bacterium]